MCEVIGVPPEVKRSPAIFATTIQSETESRVPTCVNNVESVCFDEMSLKARQIQPEKKATVHVVCTPSYQVLGQGFNERTRNEQKNLHKLLAFLLATKSY